MTNTAKLRQSIEASGLKKTYIVEQLGLSYQGFWNKENGYSEFVSSEIKTLKDLLHLSDEEVMEIFLS